MGKRQSWRAGADCKSVALKAELVQIQPCPPHLVAYGLQRRYLGYREHHSLIKRSRLTAFCQFLKENWWLVEYPSTRTWPRKTQNEQAVLSHSLIYGLLAQRESVSFTPRMSAVQSRHDPPVTGRLGSSQVQFLFEVVQTTVTEGSIPSRPTNQCMYVINEAV